MNAKFLRVEIALIALWGVSHWATLWPSVADVCETPAWAQLRPATPPPQAQQAPQLGAATSAQSLARPMLSPMFGASGRPAAPGGQGTGASATTESGSLLQGDERFLRRNRRGRGFVGNDAKDAKGFVGASVAATDEAASPAVGDVRLPGTNAAITVITKPPRVNDPRLAVGFELPRTPTDKLSALLTRHLKTIPGLHPANQIEVSVAGETATLRGVVASARDRTLAAQLLLFEPGIATVRNDLLVSPPAPDPELLDPTEAPQPLPTAHAPPKGSTAEK